TSLHLPYFHPFPTRRSSDLFFQHEAVLPSRPLLNGGEAEPVRGAVLVLALDRVAGGEVMVGINALDERPELVRPLLVAEAVQVRSEEHTSELQSRSDLVCRL